MKTFQDQESTSPFRSHLTAKCLTLGTILCSDHLIVTDVFPNYRTNGVVTFANMKQKHLRWTKEEEEMLKVALHLNTEQESIEK